MFWCMNRTNIYLEDRQMEALDRLAATEGVSRAEMIRRLLDRALAGGDRDLAADLHAIDAAFGALADIQGPERGSGERERHLDRMWRART